jgi:hypothetical protein
LDIKIGFFIISAMWLLNTWAGSTAGNGDDCDLCIDEVEELPPNFITAWRPLAGPALTIAVYSSSPCFADISPAGVNLTWGTTFPSTTLGITS